MADNKYQELVKNAWAHGTWIKTADDVLGEHVQCSVCGTPQTTQLCMGNLQWARWCPFCGAHMTVEQGGTK